MKINNSIGGLIPPMKEQPTEKLTIYTVILFYKYVSIDDPEGFATSLREFCSCLELEGRILVAKEGINGTVAGPAWKINHYVILLKMDPRFTDIEIKYSPGGKQVFPRLVVKVCREIVTLGADPEITPDRDNRLQPAEWKRMLEQDPDVVVLDVRNRYESAIGKFKNATTCEIDSFHELPDFVKELEELKEKKILMYCTGGIRCEKASALFRSRGFKNVFQLHGGIITYQKEFGNEHWLGECFVFDQSNDHPRALGEQLPAFDLQDGAWVAFEMTEQKSQFCEPR